MRIHVIEHAPDRALGIEKTIQTMSPDVEVVIIQAFLGQALPTMNECNIIISSGGPMGIYDIQKPEYEYIRKEVDFLNDSINKGKSILGICFGHQLLAHVMGGTVIRSEEKKEIGWYSITLNQDGSKDPLFKNIDSKISSFQYHYDQVVTLPNNATVLAESETTSIQAVKYGEMPLRGIQFHPEISPQIASKILTSRADKLQEIGIDIPLMINKSKIENSKNRELIFYNFLKMIR